jgi:bifunctional UDP-N-acetylglucosamine pyrophosphorylase/glucosamine-1-phosphate N-acetyltransferase
VGEETVIHPSVIIEGNSRIGRDCRIHPFVHIRNARIGNRVKIFGSTDIEDCILEDDSQAGPFSRLRPKTVVRAGARVGNFVEMKNTVFGPRSKALHLSYLGDSEVGEDVNIGAGTITCNYDGVRKNRTIIEDGVFIGSGTELVAPVKVGKKAYVAAGSTITKDVGPEALAVARARQVEKPGWVRRKRR